MCNKLFCMLHSWRTFVVHHSSVVCAAYMLHTCCISCTVRLGLHEIQTMVRTFSCGLEINHACKWISDNSPGMLTYVLFLESCQKSICMHDCSPIHEERSLRRKNTFPQGLESNHTCKWISDNFPGMLTYVLFLEICEKSICMHNFFSNPWGKVLIIVGISGSPDMRVQHKCVPFMKLLCIVHLCQH